MQSTFSGWVLRLLALPQHDQGRGITLQPTTKHVSGISTFEGGGFGRGCYLRDIFVRPENLFMCSLHPRKF